VDTKTFIVELVRALAWPGTALIALAVIRKPGMQLLGTLKRFRFGDTEAEFGQGLNEVRPQLPEMAAVVQRPSPPGQGSPELAVLDAWKSVEVAVLSLGREVSLEGKTFAETLRRLHDKGVLTDQNLDAVNGLRALRNLVAHREEPSVSEQKAAEYRAMADAVLMIIGQVSRNAKKAG
jgi:hypothetical protein